MAQTSLGFLFGLDRASIITACEGDRSTGVKQEAKHGDRILHDLVNERVSPREQSRYEANSMLSWFLREGSNVSTYATMAGHSDHSFGTVFEALLYRAAGSQRRDAVAIYMAWIDERWQHFPVQGRRPTLQAVAHDRAISGEHGSSAADGAAALAELEAWDESWAWDNDEGQLSEAELRGVLSRMHTAFAASRLGDVQEELELQAALAASAAEERDRMESVAAAMDGLRSISLTAAPRAASRASRCFFRQKHIGHCVAIIDGTLKIKPEMSSGEGKEKMKGMQEHFVIWDVGDGKPPDVTGIISRVSESSVGLEGGKVFPNPTKATDKQQKEAAKWRRFERFRGKQLTKHQRKMAAAQEATPIGSGWPAVDNAVVS